MKVTGIKSKTTLIKKIKELEYRGLIVKTKTGNKNSKYPRNEYQIVILLSSKDDTKSDNRVQQMNLDSDNQVQQMNPNQVQQMDSNYNHTNYIHNIESSPSNEQTKNINKDVNKALTVWNEYNPEIGYNKKPQRDAIKEMVESIGLDKYLDMTKLVISFQGEQFAPSVTTPYEMKLKRIKINNYLDKTNR